MDGLLPEAGASRPARRRPRAGVRRIRRLRPQRRLALIRTGVRSASLCGAEHEAGRRAAAGHERHRRRGDPGRAGRGHRRRHRPGRLSSTSPARRPNWPGCAAAITQRAEHRRDGPGAAERGPSRRSGSASAGALGATLHPALRPGPAGEAGPAAWRRRSSGSACRSTSQTPVTRDRPGTGGHRPYGTVRAAHVLRCLEGFTASIRGQRRTWLPMNSSMIVTEPLADAIWDDDRLGGQRDRWATSRTPTCTRSAPPTAGSRSAAAACPTASARAPTRPGGPSDGPSKPSPRCCTSLPGRRRGRRSLTPGAGCSACRATGARPSHWTPRPASAMPAATSAAG